ncbi:hydrolase, partial [Streptomyces pilosus]
MPDSRPQPPSDSWPTPSGSPPADPAPLLLCGARLTDGRTVDVRLGGGRIEAVGTAGSLAADGTRACGTRVDLTGYLLLPAPVEPHAHADTALSADTDGPVSHRPGDVRRRATEAALLQLGHGATALRAHVRVGDLAGLGVLTAVLEAGRSLRGLAELTTVAMPRVLTGAAGAEGLAVLRDALKMGAGVVGGCPDLDPAP